MIESAFDCVDVHLDVHWVLRVNWPTRTGSKVEMINFLVLILPNTQDGGIEREEKSTSSISNVRKRFKL